MAGYLTTAEFRALSLMPAHDIDQVVVQNPVPEELGLDFVQIQLDSCSSWVADQLRKRYEVEKFAVPYSLTLQRWVSKIVTNDLWLKLGNNPLQADALQYAAQAAQATTEIASAANGQTSLWDLPLRATDVSGAVKGGIRFHSETSPYVSMRRAAQRARTEDYLGDGTYIGRRTREG